MVGLSDIPCVGIVVDRISNAIVDIAFRGSRYLLCTKNLVKDLNSEIKKIEILEKEFTTKITEATNDGKIIRSHVLDWQKNVEKIKTEATEISEQETSCTCFRGLQFPNPAARFGLGRRAAHLAKTVTDETKSGKEYLDIEIADLPPTENCPNSDTPYQSFSSRQEAYAKLRDSIVNEDGSPILGIYGMPGVGKTRMMEQIWDEAKEKGIFKKFVRVNIGGQNIDVIKLQGQLAGSLDCHFASEDNTEARASQLKYSLRNGGKTLVILDDVWDVIPLNKIGIPFGDGSSKGCKILLTSRRKDICLQNECGDPIEIKPLTVTEAWKMFQDTVGTSIESFQDTMLAEKVCKQCGSLPLLIRAIGKALHHGTEDTWKDALYQLENQKFEEIDGIDPQVYACLQFSFVKLEEGQRICLLLCALFPEDADIEIKVLFDIATGSGKLERGRNIRGLVDKLKSSSLLLEGKDDDTVKLHDIIRDVARSVAVKDPKYAFSYVQCKSRWPTNNDDYSTRRLLHVDLERVNVHFPDDLVCHDLHTLWLQCNGHLQNRLSSFFKGFTNLRVVVLQRMRLSQEQQFSIDTLDELRMLTLEKCDIDQMFLDSVSRTLETLCIWNCSLPSPLDIPEFKDLIKLELIASSKLHVVASGISKLTRLEELNVPSGFKTSNDDSTGISAELSTLNCLTNLTIDFHQFTSCTSNVVENLAEFNISVGTSSRDFGSISSLRRAIRYRNTNMESGWWPLLERAEDVELEKVKGLPINGFSDSCNSMSREAFANLRELDMQNCNVMQHIARWDGRNQQRLKCFTNLRNLSLDSCRGLEYVFSSRVANCLLQLQTLFIDGCDGIEEIVRVDDGQEEIVSFPKLINLCLWRLPRLTSIYNNKVEFPQLRILEVRSCEKLEIVIRCTMLHGFQNLEQVDIYNCKSLKSVFHHSSPATPNMVFSALKSLTLWKTPNLECFFSYDNEFLEINNSKSYTLFTSTVFRSFRQLEQIFVWSCKLLKEIVKDGDETHDINQNTPISLPQLKRVTLSDLPNLQSSVFFACYMPALSVVEVKNCAILSLFTCSALRNLNNLTELEVSYCEFLEQISVDDMDSDTPGPSEKMISLPLLQTIKLKHLRVLKSFSSGSTFTFSMEALKKIEVYDCPCMDKFTFLQITTPLLEGDLNDYVRREVYGEYIEYTEDSAEEDGDGESDDGNSTPDVSVDGDHAEGDSESSKEYQEL